ncbi:MAG: hypothetical protein MJE68_27095 [Proteobacteria bacterium]|nr:hypothetical protein [Pseudomonadota bacterium]
MTLVETILTALGASVVGTFGLYQLVLKHHFDEKLAKFQSELTASESKINSLQSMVVSGQLKRQELIDQRRFDALDKLWVAKRQVDKMAANAAILMVLKLDDVFDRIEKDPQLSELFKVGQGKNPEDRNNLLASLPEFNECYIPEKILELYRLYFMMGCVCDLAVSSASGGFDPRKFCGVNTFNDEVIKHFPWFEKYAKKHGDYAWLYFVGPARNALASAIRNFVDGVEIDYSIIEKEINLFPKPDANVGKNVVDALDKLSPEFKKDPPAK